MSDASPRLALPYIQPSQNQKHVTHNEAVALLDAIVQLSVESRALSVPPTSPATAERHIVAAGAGGAWEGQAGRVALWQDGAWSFLDPQPGWIAWVLDEAVLVVRQGSGWSLPAGLGGGAGQVPSLGVNATADATNRLTVAAAATLLTHEGAGHQVKVNKALPGDTASLLYQTGYSGRAEMGLAGTDAFSIKVSADGTTWAPALQAQADGRLGIWTDTPTAALHVAGAVRLGSVTVAGLPDAATLGAGAILYVSDATGGAVLAVSDGTDWRRTTDRSVVD